MRGTRQQSDHDGGPIRIIPACAGNACGPYQAHRDSADHPRVCGERDKSLSPHMLTLGSSPRVRGTPPDQGTDWADGRIIPACAGNASQIRQRLSIQSDHPRVCGERIIRIPHILRGSGSSPRVRGTRLMEYSANVLDRIIPACAGNAAQGIVRHTQETDHPRVCGERENTSRNIDPQGGSSPRVRGTLRPSGLRKRGGGIIPACAGNAVRLPERMMSPPDHPRVCGERLIASAKKRSSTGSSPRVRGTQRVIPARIESERIIPACAGNASDGFPCRASVPDHPRVCGERALAMK